MSDEGGSNDQSRGKIRTILLWGCGILLVLAGIGGLAGGSILAALGGLVWIVTGLFLIPRTRHLITGSLSGAGGPELDQLGTAAFAGIVVVGFVAGGVLVPAGAMDTGTTDSGGSEAAAEAGNTPTVTETSVNTPATDSTEVSNGAAATATATSEPTATPTETPTATATATATPTAMATASPTPQQSIALEIDYEDEWSGSISVTEGGSSSQRTISGQGSETITIEGDPNSIGFSIQKQTDSTAELHVQLVSDGEVVTESSTTAEYGVASGSHSFGLF